MPQVLPFPYPENNEEHPVNTLLEIHTEDDDLVIILTSTGSLEIR